jgi:ribosomal-protein-alanine N-acetyltransferase
MLPQVTIARPTLTDCEDFLQAVARSRLLHAEWVMAPATPDAFANYIARSERSDMAAFLVRRVEDGALTGVINISQITGEPLSSAFLGFYAFKPHTRQGYMRAGLQLVLARAFDALNLHRIEANMQPGNVASLALVHKLGFRREGFSPKYLRVAGEWHDHERWAILVDDFQHANS